MNSLMITVMALSAVVTANPAPSPAIFFNGGLIPSPLTSAALIAPGPAPVVAPVGSVSAVAPIAPVSSIAPVGSVLSDYRYGYSSSYNYADYYPVVNSAFSVPYTSLPYAYAADYYFRK